MCVYKNCVYVVNIYVNCNWKFLCLAIHCPYRIFDAKTFAFAFLRWFSLILYLFYIIVVLWTFTMGCVGSFAS